MTGEITVRPRRPGDGAELARAWVDAGRYYAALAPDTFQVPETEALAVVIEEEHRRHGVGGRLMAALEAWGRERGATVSALDTYPESALSLPFFTERMGYDRRSVRLWKRL